MESPSVWPPAFHAIEEGAMALLQQLMLKALPVTTNDQCLGCHRACQQLGTESGPGVSDRRCPVGPRILGYGRWRSWLTGWRQGSADRTWRRYLSDGVKTLFQNYHLMVLAGMAVLARLSAPRQDTVRAVSQAPAGRAGPSTIRYVITPYALGASPQLPGYSVNCRASM